MKKIPEKNKSKRPVRTAYDEAVFKAERLADAALAEACLVALEEGGVCEMLSLIAVVIHGGVLPSSCVLRLQRKASEIVTADAVKTG